MFLWNISVRFLQGPLQKKWHSAAGCAQPSSRVCLTTPLLTPNRCNRDRPYLGWSWVKKRKGKWSKGERSRTASPLVSDLPVLTLRELLPRISLSLHKGGPRLPYPPSCSRRLTSQQNIIRIWWGEPGPCPAATGWWLRFTLICHVLNVDLAFIGHEADNWEDDKASKDARGTVGAGDN